VLKDISDIFSQPLTTPTPTPGNWDSSTSALGTMMTAGPLAAAAVVPGSTTVSQKLGTTISTQVGTPGIGNIPMEDSDLAYDKSPSTQQSSLIKTIASMLADRGVGSLHPLEYPL
jgi:hypothetical protein